MRNLKIFGKKHQENDARDVTSLPGERLKKSKLVSYLNKQGTFYQRQIPPPQAEVISPSAHDHANILLYFS